MFAVDEFIRRFLLHVLPDGMHRIRHFGIPANGCRAGTLESARQALGSIGCPDRRVDDDAPEDEPVRDEIAESGAAPVTCPDCGAVLRPVHDIPRQRPAHASRAPPDERAGQGSRP